MSDDKEMEEVTEEVTSMFESLDEPDRAVLLQELASRWCVSCGHDLPDDGSDCPCTDEEEEDADDEDDDDAGDDGDPDDDDE